MRRHERTNKHINNSDQNNLHQKRITNCDNFLDTRTLRVPKNQERTDTSSSINSSNQQGLNIASDENSFTYDRNKFIENQEAQSFNPNGSDMNDDDSRDVNSTSATRNEQNDHNSIDTNSYTTLIIDIDENYETYSDNYDISSVFSDNINDNSIGSLEEDDIVNDHPLMNRINNIQFFMI